MPLHNFLLTIHILGAIAIFGVTFSYPFIGALAQKPGAPVAWAIRAIETMDNKWVNPLALTLQPASGAWLIVDSHNLWNPFIARNRWLLAAIIIYILANGFALAVQGRWARKALHLAEASEFGPEFGATMKKINMGGQLLTVMLVAIVVLMVVKPGSGFIHQ